MTTQRQGRDESVTFGRVSRLEPVDNAEQAGLRARAGVPSRNRSRVFEADPIPLGSRRNASLAVYCGKDACKRRRADEFARSVPFCFDQVRARLFCARADAGKAESICVGRCPAAAMVRLCRREHGFDAARHGPLRHGWVWQLGSTGTADARLSQDAALIWFGRSSRRCRAFRLRRPSEAAPAASCWKQFKPNRS